MEKIAGPVPWQADHDHEAVLGGRVEEMSVGGGVEADRVESGRGNARNFLLGVEDLIRGKGAEGDRLDEDPFPPALEKAAVETEGTWTGEGHGRN